MRTTLDIDDDVLAAAKAKARHERRSTGSVVSELARRGLHSPGDTRDDDPPTFAVPPDARPFTSEDVRRALDEEW